MKLKEVKGLQKYLGLMFRTKKTTPLLFKFSSESTTPIHSLFVFFKFIAVWFDEDCEVVDSKIVTPFTLSINSSRSFRYLIEIPII